MDSNENKDVSDMRSAQLALAFNPGVFHDSQESMEANPSCTAASANYMPMAEELQEYRTAWNVEHLADAICRMLDSRDRMLASKAERRVRAMRTRSFNRTKNKSHSSHNSGVVAIPQTERFRRFLSNSRSAER